MSIYQDLESLLNDLVKFHDFLEEEIYRDLKKENYDLTSTKTNIENLTNSIEEIRGKLVSKWHLSSEAKKYGEAAEEIEEIGRIIESPMINQSVTSGAKIRVLRYYEDKLEDVFKRVKEILETLNNPFEEHRKMLRLSQNSLD